MIDSAIQTGDLAGTGPKVSVITVVLNSRDLIEATILSVIGQKYPNKEFIVVDGISTDGTIDIINHYKSRIDTIIVEKDKGIYDAMNKAVKLACGDYVLFMNSGDTFVDETSLNNLCKDVSPEDTLIYSGWIVTYPWGLERTENPGPLDEIWRGMFVQHQSTMVKTSYMRRHPFDLTAGLGADYALLLKLINTGEKVRKCPGHVSRVSAGGMSDGNRFAVLRSHWTQARKYYPHWQIDLHYMALYVNFFLSNMAKKLLPQSTVRYLISRKH